MRSLRWIGFTLFALLALPILAHAVLPIYSVTNFAGDDQHTANYGVTAQDMNSIHWSTSIDLHNTGDYVHYGAPVITSSNTILVPVKTATGFMVNAFNAITGAAIYSLSTDYILPPHDWIPVYQPALAVTPTTKFYYPGAGGTVYSIDNVDSAGHGVPVQTVFYTSLANYQANAAAFNASVFINTPITSDYTGNIYFGFRVVGTAPAPLSTTQSGFARIDQTGTATYVLAGPASGDPQISYDSHNSAPALSADQSTLYVVVKSAATENYGYLLGLDSTTLATKYKVLLKDPRNNAPAGILDNSTASPTVAPDGDVYFGVMANPPNGSRGFLLRFSGDLATKKTPGGFGWDSTPGIVPASMVPSYQGASSYLIFSKYNNYAEADGNGVNQMALLDPASTQADPHYSSGGLSEMRVVMSVNGPTPDDDHPTLPKAVHEWCIDTAAINPPTQSVFFPSEDGHIYRWNLKTNTLDNAVVLGSGVGEPYVPTIIGPDGTIFTLNGGTLFAVGDLLKAHVSLASAVTTPATITSGPSFVFTALVSTTTLSAPAPTGTVTFQDTYFATGFDTVGAATTVLAANVPLDSNGQAAVSASALVVGSHFITATYSGDTNLPSGSVTLIQEVQTTAPDPSLSGIKAYPSPWRSDRHSGRPIIFAGLLPSSTIKIFTVSGRWVITISAASDEVSWDLKNDSGDLVASGLYLYLINDPLGHKTVGKFAVIR